MEVETVTTPNLELKNLSPDFGETELEHLFIGIGTIASREIHEDGKATVEMSSVEEAQNAVRFLDGKDFMGKQLSVGGASEPIAEENEEAVTD